MKWSQTCQPCIEKAKKIFENCLKYNFEIFTLNKDGTPGQKLIEFKRETEGFVYKKPEGTNDTTKETSNG